ncbi:MAG: CHASE2 domain-containing protein [bacterium]
MKYFDLNYISDIFSSWRNDINERLTRTALIIFTVFLLVLVLISAGDAYLIEDSILNRIEYPLVDWRHRLYSQSVEVDEDVVLLAITDNSIEQFSRSLGRFPWPRRVFAALINHLKQAKSVAFDIGFWEPSNVELSPAVAGDILNRLQKLRNNFQERRLEKSDRQLENLILNFRELGQPDDYQLSAATREAGNVIHSFAFSSVPGYSPPDEEQIQQFNKKYAWTGTGDKEFPGRSRLILPIEGLIENSDGLGHIAFSSAPDGVARKFYPFIGLSGEEAKENVFPFLGLAAALREKNTVKFSENQMKFDNRVLPVDSQGRVPLRFRGDWSDYQVIPIERVLTPLITGEDKEYPADFFAGRTVFIGATAAGLGDLKPAPVNSTYPGMAFHAAVYDSIKSGDFLRPRFSLETIGLVFILGLLGGFSALLFPPLAGLLVLLGIILGYFYLGISLFFSGYLINLAQPAVSALIMFGLITTYNVMRERRRREFVREAFQHYLPESVLETVLANPEDLELKARRRELTVLFLDIAGFTTLSENMEATEVAGRLNELLTEMTSCVFRHDGVLDKFIGDELMAEFGLLDAEPSDPEARACRAADDMLEALRKFNEEAEGEPLGVRIGIHTGKVAAGNMGSEDLFDYTVIGDAVNLGSRLEGVNKFYGSDCMLSESTADRLDRNAIIRELDSVVVKGREEPVTIYEWLGWRGEVSKEVADSAWHYEEALEFYRQKEFEEAIQQLDNIDRQDEPARRLKERCRQLIDNPPEENWEPVTVLESK